jgi:hypothetical protein
MRRLKFGEKKSKRISWCQRHPTKLWLFLVSMTTVMWFNFASHWTNEQFDPTVYGGIESSGIKHHDSSSSLEKTSTGNALLRPKMTATPRSLSELEEKYYKYWYRPPDPRKDYQLDPTCGEPPMFQSFFEQSQMFRSSRNEDKTIYDLFFRDRDLKASNRTRSENFYVELGAFNGRRESNTRFLDLCLNWEGLLIEANPLKYPKLTENRPHAHCLNFAPSCPSPTQVAFHSVAFTNAAQANVANFYDNTSLVNVPCDRLTPALVDVLGGYVTFFSLDVEGAENQVLRTVDFDKIHVEIWMMENVNQFCQKEKKCESRDESRSILQRAGYVGYEDVVHGSDLFVLPDSKYDKLLKEKLQSSAHRIGTVELGSTMYGVDVST